MGAGRKTQTIYLKEKPLPSSTVNCSVSARNLGKSELGGVIFGCKNYTINECFTSQLFGLPGPHYSYVKNISPGLPLFLFNYSERKLHGIFEAACYGGWNINPYGWTSDGSDLTPYSAQVKIQIRMRCEPLLEEQFSPAIAKNYYEPKLFWFELDRDQTRTLISLFSSSPARSTLFKGSHAPNVRQEGENIKTFDANQANSSRGMSSVLPQKSWSALFKDEASFDAKEVIVEDNARHEVGTDNTESSNAIQTNIVRGESIALPQEPWSLLFKNETVTNPREVITEDTDGEDPEAHSKKTMETTLPQEPWSALFINEIGSEAREMVAVDNHEDDLEEKVNETMVSELKSPDLHTIVTKLSLELEDLRLSQLMQVRKINYLQHELVESRAEIQQLKERCKMLESVSFPATGLLDKEEFQSSDECYPNLDEVILIGGFDGSLWLSSLDSYSLSQDLMKSLSSIRSMCSYASTAKLNGELYIFGGVKGNLWSDIVESYNPVNNQWTSRPSLNQKKGGLAGVSLGDKIFAVGGGNGTECFSDVEMLDLDAGRWIPTLSMFHKRFAPAAAEINGMLYAVGGYNGQDYLKSVERYDPRQHSWTGLESMTTKRAWHSLVVLNEKLFALGGYDGDTIVPTVEVFDPRVGLWMNGESMNSSRGYFGAIVMGDTIYVVGGLSNDDEILDTVECYKEGYGWQVTNLKAIGKRSFFSAVVL